MAGVFGDPVWVFKPDGTIQGQEDEKVGLDAMRLELTGLIGEQEILESRKIHASIAQMDGMPTGARNAYKITGLGRLILFQGFAGPSGFQICAEHVLEDIDAASPDNAPPHSLHEILETSDITSVATTPVLVRDILGLCVRVYRQGETLCPAHAPRRVNMELGPNDRVTKIWFG